MDAVDGQAAASRLGIVELRPKSASSNCFRRPGIFTDSLLGLIRALDATGAGRWRNIFRQAPLQGGSQCGLYGEAHRQIRGSKQPRPAMPHKDCLRYRPETAGNA